MADILIKGHRKGSTFMQEDHILDAIGRGDNPIILCNGVYFTVTGQEGGWVYSALERKPDFNPEETTQ